MKKKFLFSKYAIALSSLMIFASCQNSDVEVAENSDGRLEVKFEAEAGGSSTRLNSESTGGSTFDAGDQVGLTKDINSTIAIYDCQGANWNLDSSSPKLYWDMSGAPNNFYAYYPYGGSTNYINFDLPLDQSDLTSFRSADYCRGTKTYSNPTYSSDGKVKMNLDHECARVCVQIAGWGDQYQQPPTFDEVRLATTAQHFGSYKLYDSDPDTHFGWAFPLHYFQNMKDDARFVASTVNCVPLAMGNTVSLYGQTGTFNDYYGIVPPRSASSTSPFAYFKLSGASDYMHVNGAPELEAGKAYTIRCWIGHDEIHIAKVTVHDWVDTTEIFPGTSAVPATKVGWYYTKDGQCTPTYNSNCIGIVFALSSGYNTDDLTTDRNAYSSHGRVVALHDDDVESVAVSGIGNVNLSKLYQWGNPTYHVLSGSNAFCSCEDSARVNTNGFKNYQACYNGSQLYTVPDVYVWTSPCFPAMYACVNTYNAKVTCPTDANTGDALTTKWYLPSIGELACIRSVFSSEIGRTSAGVDGFCYLNGNTYQAYRRTYNYWSSSAYDGKAWYMNMSTGTISLGEQEQVTCHVRPVFAF